jgi:hypothetical protein
VENEGACPRSYRRDGPNRHPARQATKDRFRLGTFMRTEIDEEVNEEVKRFSGLLKRTHAGTPAGDTPAES